MENRLRLRRLNDGLEMVDDVKHMAVPQSVGMPLVRSAGPNMFMRLHAKANGGFQTAEIGQYLRPPEKACPETPCAGYGVSGHEKSLLMSVAGYGRLHKRTIGFLSRNGTCLMENGLRLGRFDVGDESAGAVQQCAIADNFTAKTGRKFGVIGLKLHEAFAGGCFDVAEIGKRLLLGKPVGGFRERKVNRFEALGHDGFHVMIEANIAVLARPGKGFSSSGNTPALEVAMHPARHVCEVAKNFPRRELQRWEPVDRFPVLREVFRLPLTGNESVARCQRQMHFDRRTLPGAVEIVIVPIRRRECACDISAERFVTRQPQSASFAHNTEAAFAVSHSHAPKLRLGETHVPVNFLARGEKTLPVVVKIGYARY